MAWLVAGLPHSEPHLIFVLSHILAAIHLSARIHLSALIMLFGSDPYWCRTIPGAPANPGAHQFATAVRLSPYGVPHTQVAAFPLVVSTVLTISLLLIGLCACPSAGLSWNRFRQLMSPAADSVATGRNISCQIPLLSVSVKV